MEFPELYRKAAFLSKRDSNVALQEFVLKNRLKENASVFDIGSGDGSTSKHILEKHLPPSYSKIVGCDVSVKMVKYANEHFKSERIEFIQADVTKPLPLPWRGVFDHAFSFYTFQRIPQQKAAFSFIYNSLKEGGTCLLTFLGRYPVYDVYRTLSRMEKWAEALKDVETFTSPYHDSKEALGTRTYERIGRRPGRKVFFLSGGLFCFGIPNVWLKDPKKDVMTIMDSVSFKEVEVNIYENTHTYDDDNTFKCLVKAINPFSVLNDRWDEFMTDFFEVAPNAIKLDYQLIVAYGVK